MVFTTENGAKVTLTEADVSNIIKTSLSSTLKEINECVDSSKEDLAKVRRFIHDNGCLDNGCCESEETYEAGYVSGAEYVLSKLHLA